MKTILAVVPVRVLAALGAALAAALFPAAAGAQSAQSMQELLGPGDTIRITAFRYPELTSEVRISDEGRVNLPMLGEVELQGLTPGQAAARIADGLKRGNFIRQPQIDVAVLEARSRQVSVLGFVTRPGRYVLDGRNAKVTDVIAMAGGLVPAASDVAVVKRMRNGQSESLNVDLAAIMQGADDSKNIDVASGDSIFVPKAPVVYVYGEVMRGGSYRLEPGMTVMQAISVAGGVTPRGTESRAKLRRRDAEGHWKEAIAQPHDVLAADDVIFIRESLF